MLKCIEAYQERDNGGEVTRYEPGDVIDDPALEAHLLRCPSCFERVADPAADPDTKGAKGGANKALKAGSTETKATPPAEPSAVMTPANTPALVQDKA